MNYKWIIFDADGTLFDYDMAEISALKVTIEHFGHVYNPDYLEVYRQCNKKLWDAFELGEVTLEKLKIQRFELFLNSLKFDNNPSEFSRNYLLQLSRGTQLISGAEEILQTLSGKVGMILMTNGIKEVQRSRLNLSSIKSYFSDIIISDEVGVAKPDKKIFEIALQNMSISDKDTILMVGDNLSSDIKGGMDFGIDTCWYNPNMNDHHPEIHATYEVRNLEDLLSIVGVD
jgi:YjjG family noncanonical pyrimidine nucleotidase